MYNLSYPTREQYIEVIELMQEVVEDKKVDTMLYDWLANNTPTHLLPQEQLQGIKDTIISIKEDEARHHKIFIDIYAQLTRKDPKSKGDKFTIPSNFVYGIIEALRGELEAAKKCASIMAGLSSNYYRDKIFEILIDELRHANLCSYIYTVIQTK